MLIVFLNFLIAIVSQVYENDLAKTLQNEYTQKAEMNLETEHLLTSLGFMEEQNFFILTGSKKDKIDSNLDEWQGFVSQIKQNQKQETAALRFEMRAIKSDIDNKLDAIERRLLNALQK